MTYGSVSRLNSSRRHREEQNRRSKQWYNANKERARTYRRESDKRRRSMGLSVCEILSNHHLKLKDDPERLTTEFMQSLIGVKCKKMFESEASTKGA